MKIRMGFISNSSASSFIVKEKDFNKIECDNCKAVLELVLPKQRAEDFMEKHWAGSSWNTYKKEYGLDKNDFIYANHIKYDNPMHKRLDSLLSELNIDYIKENE